MSAIASTAGSKTAEAAKDGNQPARDLREAIRRVISELPDAEKIPIGVGELTICGLKPNYSDTW